MNTGTFWWLAGLIAAHQNRQVIGRTRLQKEVMLLQRLKFPTDYLYTIFFYGPYSEGVRSDLRLLEQLKLVKEEELRNQEGIPYYVITGTQEAALPEIEPFRPAISLMEKADAVVLELAATYDAFRELGSDHEEALQKLRRKKGSKCDNGKEEAALDLLKRLELPTE